MAKQKSTNVGITIGTEWIELVKLSKDLRSVELSIITPTPMATLDSTGDKVLDPTILATTIASMIAEVGTRVSIKDVNVTVPSTLVRIVEMPKMPKNELVLALTSEAERYAIFNDTEALVDYEVISEDVDGKQKLMLVALRKDSLSAYKSAFKASRLNIASMEVENFSTLRGLKFSGRLNHILEEVEDQHWGTIHFEPERIRIGLWQGDKITNWREVLLDTSELKSLGEDSSVIQDIVEEVRRTIGMMRPVLWLTSGIPERLATKLSSRLGANVKPMLAGDNVSLDNPKLSLAAIGIASKSFDPFPIDINIKPTSETEEAEFSSSFKIMMGVAVGLLVLVIVTTVGMLGLSAFLGFNNDNATKKIQQLETDIKTTEASIEELNKKTSVGREISTRTITIVNRNAAMVNVIESIKSKIPSRLWLKNVIIGDNITLEGESLDYSSILTFSKGFSNGTEASAINNMTLENIEEFNEQGVRVYKFTMVGQLKL